jgi:hypothetical protein
MHRMAYKPEIRGDVRSDGCGCLDPRCQGGGLCDDGQASRYRAVKYQRQRVLSCILQQQHNLLHLHFDLHPTKALSTFGA